MCHLYLVAPINRLTSFQLQSTRIHISSLRFRLQRKLRALHLLPSGTLYLVAAVIYNISRCELVKRALLPLHNQLVLARRYSQLDGDDA